MGGFGYLDSDTLWLGQRLGATVRATFAVLHGEDEASDIELNIRQGQGTWEGESKEI